MIMRSNELRLYTPTPDICSDGSIPNVFTIPPILRPDGAPTRPLYTNVDALGLPDYSSYTGTGDLTFIPGGFWRGGAAKNGVWNTWINNNAKRVGSRAYTFTNALPWEIYWICPIADITLPQVLNGENATLPGTTFGYYNACADPENLRCPVESDGRIAWNLTWTTYGWLCIKHTCLLQMDENPNPGAGEAWNCDE